MVNTLVVSFGRASTRTYCRRAQGVGTEELGCGSMLLDGANDVEERVPRLESDIEKTSTCGHKSVRRTGAERK
jgi:hypothetical protein